MKTIVIEVTDEADELLTEAAEKIGITKAEYIKIMFKYGLVSQKLDAAAIAYAKEQAQ